MQQEKDSKRKYKILLIIPREVGGVEFHRLTAPHAHLKRNYPEFDVERCHNLDHATDEQIQEVNPSIVVFNRMASVTGTNAHLIHRLHRLGIKTVCDVDDHWTLSHNHLLRDHFKEHNIPGQVIETLMAASHVTCTHDLLASQIPAKQRKDITVIPNAIDPVGQFQFKERAKDTRLQFGWVGGACHEEDINLLKESMIDFHRSGMKATVNLCGFSIDPVYLRYELVMSGGRISTPQSYSRMQGQPIDRYGFIYDWIDVSMVPLNDNLFNRCKSNLKLLEAGFKKRAVICQNIHPYTSILKHGVNGLAVNNGDNKRGWFKAMKRYYDNREMITDHAEQLYQDVQEYHMDKVNVLRYQLYKKLIEG